MLEDVRPQYSYHWAGKISEDTFEKVEETSGRALSNEVRASISGACSEYSKNFCSYAKAADKAELDPVLSAISSHASSLYALLWRVLDMGSRSSDDLVEQYASSLSESPTEGEKRKLRARLLSEPKSWPVIKTTNKKTGGRIGGERIFHRAGDAIIGLPGPNDIDSGKLWDTLVNVGDLAQRAAAVKNYLKASSGAGGDPFLGELLLAINECYAKSPVVRKVFLSREKYFEPILQEIEKGCILILGGCEGAGDPDAGWTPMTTKFQDCRLTPAVLRDAEKHRINRINFKSSLHKKISAEKKRRKSN